MFAAVIAARWIDGDAEAEEKSTHWLEHSAKALHPHAIGIYGSDLGPKDTQLARRALDLNSFRLAQMKREADPLNVLGCACPLLEDNDPRIQNRGVVVIFCGRRCAGKDWIAEVTKELLKKLLDDTDGSVVATVGISDETKYAYAKEDPSVNADSLIFDRHYKKKHDCWHT
jgi:hypothetical protein